MNLVRGFVRRVTVVPPEGGGNQQLDIETGSSMNAQLADQYREVDCGGVQQLDLQLEELSAAIVTPMTAAVGYA